MSNWRELLKEAKELFEDGLLDESEYKAEKTRIMAMRSQSTNSGTFMVNVREVYKTWPVDSSERESCSEGV
jgi:hypothetical protein